ncbi:energy-coupling factor transporter transmembrane protein EcfT [Irregularibacter muris]|uniref:Energy-coupling factor transporter transmembrane protein EcfT n=1 Tax=Irregularibacter muris TaxID=1796619 RepID=A0AAE3KYU8_9FIRM|nr:energy-coupling factor transporter transmembrane component T [Irregularibacter muris]MCR1898230.1 energy-coupling factor transporter transmembrane protein EcfT [Irregularibacter muris]
MSAFASYHPIVLFSYFTLVILFSMFYMHPVYLGISLFSSILFLGSLKGISALKKSIFFSIPVFLLIALSNPLFNHKGVTPLFYMNHNPITLEAILYGLGMATMILTVLFWFGCYHEFMTSDKFICLFGPFLPSMALVLSMTLRLVPKFKHQIQLITNSQKTLGMYITSGSILKRGKSGMRILSILITWALENAIDTADSMKARGYGLKPRSSYSLFRFSKRDGLFLGITLLLGGLIILGETLGCSSFLYYPYVSPLEFSPLALFFYFCYFVLMILPVVVESKEEMTWRLSISKI